MNRPRPHIWALVAFAIVLPPLAYALLTQRFGWAAIGLTCLIAVRVVGFSRNQHDDDE